jgi:ABC-type Fe3+-hydroxamate transport system substrate-binding protein
MKAIFFLVFFVTFSLFAESQDFRIVSLNPALTEILFKLELGKKIVGTSTFSDYPAEAKKIVSIGSYLQPNIEKIIELRPTHVLAFREGDPSIKFSLQKSKTPTIIFESLDLKSYPDIIKKIGATFNADSVAQKVIAEWNQQLQKLSQYKIKKKIMIQVDYDPIFVAGGNTFISEILEKCGLENSYKELQGFKRVSIESAMEHKPDAILVAGHTQNFAEAQRLWKSNPTTKNSFILEGDADSLSRLGPRLPNAALEICSKIQKSSGF